MLRFNKLASIILALVMAVTLLPGVTMTALAADANFSGSGTEADPFIIENNTKLLKLASLVNDNFSSPYGASTVYYKLSDDFDNSSEPFTGTIGNATTKTFHANFDGNQKTIHLNIEGGSFTYLGLLGYASGAVIKNLRTEGVVTSLYSTGTHYIGGIVGYATDTEIINCVSAMSISEKASGTVGGIVGYFGGTAAYNFLSKLRLISHRLS